MSPKTSSTKTLSIDIETYSSNNLNECGVYKYCEAPDFEILLFGYSVDGCDVQVVDLADGEVIPPHIISLIKSDDCLKYSFNCSFERICLSRFLGMKTGEYLAPESWRCTMVASSYLGLPLSLKGVGAVLGLDEQKMEEGKELIKFFCTPVKPSKANGGVTRNLFKYNTYKRDMMIKYCKRDVEVQMNIQKRLENYPLPDWLWAEYHLDQRINDRGVFLDQELAAKAIKIDGIIHQELEKAMTEITEIDNPNSPAQIKVWLAKYGVEPEDLGKKSVAALEKEFSGNDIGDVMRLRQMLAKTSTKKYERMMSAVCSDGRIRGMFQFYGANRTGRFSSRLVQLHNLPQNKIHMIPVFGSVAAGFGAYASSDIIEYIPLYIENDCDVENTICITVKGQSMYPKIEEGDRIVVRRQDSVDNGRIAVVMIGDEAVVKRVECEKNKLTLISINPEYPPRVIEGKDLEDVRIVGLVQEVMKRL